VTGLVNGTSYLFRVAAVNVAGAGATGLSTAVTPRTVAGAPTAVVGVAGDSQVELSWTAPASNGGAAITDYVVRYSSNNGTSWTTFADGRSTSTTAMVTGLVNGTSYLFRVVAVNAAGTSEFAQSPATVPFAPAAAPTALTGSVSSGRVSLAWTAPASPRPIIDYVIQYRTDVVGSAWMTFNDGVSASATATVTGLSNGVRYRFRVAAVNGDGTGFFTDGTAVFTPVTVPVAPSGVTGTGSRGVITLNWTAASSTPQAPVTGYVIQYRVNTTSAQWVTLPLAVGNQTTATINTLTSRLGYRFRVAAQNAAGIGPWSAESALIRPY
ncbi:MAG: fibronectin type III domain-containing protein, partial [Planctomycetia bacterium]